MARGDRGRASACLGRDAERADARDASVRPQFAADRDVLAAIFDRPDKIPYIARRGPYFYNFWTDAQQPRGLWRRTTLESFRLEQPAWEILLDLDALAAAEGEDWIWGGASTRPGTHDRAIVRLSRGGSDAVVLREFDLAAQAFVSDGFSLPEAKGAGELARPRHAAGEQRLGRRRRPRRAMPGRCGCGARRPTQRRCRLSSKYRGRACRPAPRSIARRRPERSGSTIGRLLRREGLARRCRRQARDQARPADRRPGRCASRLDHRQAAHGVDRRRQDLSGRRAAGHEARCVPRRRSRFRRAVRARPAAFAAGFLLGRRSAACCRSSTICSRYSRS